MALSAAPCRLARVGNVIALLDRFEFWPEACTETI
jgi:hypothetical protein